MSLISKLTTFGAAGAGGDSYWGMEVSGPLGIPVTQGEITSDADNVYAMFRQGDYKSGDTRTKVPVMSISKDGVVNWQKMYGENQSSDYLATTALANSTDYIFFGYEEGTSNGVLYLNKSDGTYAQSKFFSGTDGTIEYTQSACPADFDGTNNFAVVSKHTYTYQWNNLFVLNSTGGLVTRRLFGDNGPANIFYNTGIQMDSSGDLYGMYWRIRSTNNERQIYVFKLEDNSSGDRLGQAAWVKRFASPDGATTVCEGVGFALDGNKNCFMTGYTRVSSSYEYLISRIRSYDNAVTTKKIVKNGYDWDNTQGSRNFMACDADNNVFILGKTIDQTGSYYVPRILKLDNAMNNILAHVELDHTDQFANWAFDIDPEGNIYFMSSGLGTSNNDMAIMKLPNDLSITGTYGDFEITSRSDASLSSYSNASWGDGVNTTFDSSSVTISNNGTDYDNTSFTTSLQNF